MSYGQNEIHGRIYSSDEWKGWSPRSPAANPLPGEYVVRIFDEEKNLTGLVRDPFGLMPVYYSTRGGLRFWYSLKEAVAELKNVEVNWEYVYAVLGGHFSLLDQSPFLEIKRLPQGHILFQKDGHWQTRAFFREIEPEPRANLRDLFLQVVEERAKKYPDFCLSLSGGLDSSLLFAIMRYTKSPGDAMTLSFPPGEESEEEGLRALERRWGPHFARVSPPDIGTGMYDWKRGEYFMYDPTETFSNPIFAYAKSKNLSHVWVGWGADEVFNLNSCLLSALLEQGEIREFYSAAKWRAKTNASSASVLYEIIRDFAPQAIKRKLASRIGAAKGFVHPRAAHYARLQRAERLQRTRKGRIANELAERLFHSGTVAFAAEQTHELAHARGLSFSYPYLDTRLVAVSTALKARDFYHAGLNKYVLRDSFRDILPREITDFPSRQNYSRWSGAVVLAQQTELASLFESAKRNRDELSIGKKLFDSPFSFKNIRTILKLTYLAQFESAEKEFSHGKKETLQETTA